MKKSATPGGNRLRALREFCGKTQLDVELDASLGIGYLQRVESGKVRYPERDTLERILGALGAHYTERRDILELFGYMVDTPVPDEREIEWAIAACQSELSEAVFPVYLLDCTHRLLTWNRFVPLIFGLTDRQIARASMIRMVFDPTFRVTPLIANPEVFFPAQIRALRYEMRLFRGESWYDRLIAEMIDQCPLFAAYWTLDDRDSLIAARPLVPLVIDLPDVGVLRFRLTSEPFAQDRRFRIIYYIPADAPTIQQCVNWLEVG
jgi:transcriptional regulator with XRE-family HTH domain